jgi:UDP-N-acetylmuramoyl-L-alanyl-D-glutamate--2,6-diaminopimelate ligase
VAVVTGQEIEGAPLPQVVVSEINPAASRLANLLLEEPAKKVSVLGVTGTNGKTTTAYLIRHIQGTLWRRCGMIGTVEIDDGRTRREATMTTPGAVEIAQLLATMRDRGVWSCAMEVSSHALDQGRVAGVRFAAAGFTNLTGDHLDYHQTIENYAAAKAKLFEQLDRDAVAVVNINDKYAQRMVERTPARVITFGLGRKGDYRATDIDITAEGSSFTLITPDGQAGVRMGLIGKHNIANALTAVAMVAESHHLPLDKMVAALESAEGAPGRLQAVRCGQPYGVFVDYAHTDDGLENVLGALRGLTRGRLRVLFGCGGDRDRTKRPRMAKVAEQLADVLYITSDNPRTEDPGKIIAEVVEGLSPKIELINAPQGLKRKGRRLATASGRVAVIDADRQAAIDRIIADAEPGDVVLLAGKGHENYQIVGREKRHFDDVEEATRALHGRSTAAA